jgi:hypothetical protein
LSSFSGRCSGSGRPGGCGGAIGDQLVGFRG